MRDTPYRVLLPDFGRSLCQPWMSVRILKLLDGFWQPDQPGLPAHFKPDVTVSAGPPAPRRPKKKGH